MTAPFNLFEASIDQVLDALDRGAVTAVELVGSYLARVGGYDRSGVRLNAIPVLNPNIFAEAERSDRRRRAGVAGALEGVPFTVKDSYMVKGLTVAGGSPAFKDLVAGHDAFTVARIRAAGGVLIGKTNMPPMADGGMQRGVYGRAESPYNSGYLAAAYASGSSNGSGVATAANLGVFGMGEETVSSGRSPASNNSLCAYTPSRGVLSIRGNWPLFPTRDVVVPHTRTMADMLALLDVIVVDDEKTEGDFWREQRAVTLPAASEVRPESYRALEDARSLAGKTFGVPKMYLGKDPAFPIDVRESILTLWENARTRLESLGATVVEVALPVVEKYEGAMPGGEQLGKLGVLPKPWMDYEFNEFITYGWDAFLRINGDPALHHLADVDHARIFPNPPGGLPDRYSEVDDYENRYRDVVAMAADGVPDLGSLPGFADGLRALEAMRKEWFEDWLRAEGLDGIVFPANADVALADSDLNVEPADLAWKNGVFYSNANYVLRHLGIPSITVPMGVMADTGMPVGLTIAGAAYDDNALLAYGYAFEAAGSMRRAAPLAPPLPSDTFCPRQSRPASDDAVAPELTVAASFADGPLNEGARLVNVRGTVTADPDAQLHLTINGVPAAAIRTGGTWSASAVLPAQAEPQEIGGNPLASRALVVVHVVEPNGLAAGAFMEL
ncbi:amidase (plasmid) [Arthrobacter sp. ERGS1:01]|uniref:amidase n=1 Tax=Arthrobacter sp. ERGS1:01 TaxID=1704044 RepID=UPI0006B45691|nr:amidase [Arthrobacter sp. ERGS1:01]ALE04289.1 amidase [Arthrobacter sp. ERGS1:01]